MNHEDLLADRERLFIELPKYSKQVEEILVDLINSVKKSQEKSSSGALLAVV